MENRSYVLDRLKSKTMTIDEFNYDSLQAPPIAALFTPMDIMQLNQIARSIKYAAKPQLKYQEIDKIMRRRGFEKFVAGTNRVAYRFLEDNSFIVKVAADAVGLGDNPREFRNQMIFKPFVTKVFEVTPCGTIGVFERVVPITHRQEFLSVASDIYEVINNWFIGEYVLEDIGTKYFLNYGIRKGFGPVLLDFPYVYKLDGNKLFCNAPNNSNPSGCCEGVIDYDAGFNFLYCTKCGVKYKAKELEQAVKENNIIVKSEGEIKMKVRIKGGTNDVSKTIVTGEFADQAKAMPTKPVKGKVTVSLKANEEKKDENRNIHVTLSSDKNIKEESKPRSIIASGKNKVEKVVEEVKSEDAVVKAEVQTTEENKNSTTCTKEVISPIEFDESLIKKTEKEDTVKEKSAIETFNDHLKAALNVFENADEEDKKQMEDAIIEAFKDQIDIIIDSMLKSTKDESEEEKCECSCDKEQQASYDRLVAILNRAGDMIDELQETFADMSDEAEEEFVKSISKSLIDTIIYYSLKTGEYSISLSGDKKIYYSYEDEIILMDLVPVIADDNGVVFEDEDFGLGISPSALVEPMTEAGLIPEDNTVKEADVYKEYKDCKFFAGSVINVKDIFQNKESSKSLVIIDENGNYLTMDGNVIMVDVIDNRDVDDLSIVSSEWLNETLKPLNEQTFEVADEYEEETVTDEDSEEEVEEEISIPTGVLPPNVSVNGVPVEDEEVQE